MATQYTQQDYLRYIKRSKNKHLLVEGVTDKRIFKLLFDEWKQQNNINAKATEEIVIDTAECLVNINDAPGNCDRVKKICQSIENKPYNYKLVGFIDREFNEFQYISDFEDKLKKHKIQGRLIWSRGHSIENYFFEYLILREYFRGLALASESFNEALEVFSRQLLESILKIACAVTLASKEIGKMGKIEDRIIQDFFQIMNNELVIKLEDLKENLIKSKTDFTTEEAEKFCEEYLNFYSKISSCQDYQTIRWLCHGHIGMKLISLSYDLCIDEFKDSNKKYTKTKEHIKINGIANIWAVKALNGQCVYPKEVFQLFGIDS